MAYIRQQDDEEEQRQAPGNAGGTMIAGSAPMAGATAAPQQTPQQRQGSGNFTNLRSWLDAGKGRDQGLQTAGATTLAAENKTFDDAKKPLEDATFTASTLSADDVGKNVGAASRGDTNAFDTLKNTLGQAYDGVRTINYDPAESKGLRSLDALSSAATAGAELAGENSYGAGARRMDAALFGSDPLSQAAIGANKTGADEFLTRAKADAGRLDAKVQGFDKAAADASSSTRTELERLGDWVRSNVDKRKAGLQSEEAARAGRPGDVRAGYKTTYKEGSPITEGNVISKDEASWMDTLSKLVGIDPIKKTGSVKAGTFDSQFDPTQNMAPPSENWLSNEKAWQSGAPTGEAGGRQTLLNPGQASYYQSEDGSLVNKETGATMSAADKQKMSDALASGEVTAAGGLAAWLRKNGIASPY